MEDQEATCREEARSWQRDKRLATIPPICINWEKVELDSLVTILSKEHPLIIPSISAAVKIENTKNVSQCRNVVLLNGFAIIWNSVEIACGGAVIGNAQGKGEKGKFVRRSR